MREYGPSYKLVVGDKHQNHKVPSIPISDGSTDGHAKVETQMIDLNMKPNRLHGQASNNQVRLISLINNLYLFQFNLQYQCKGLFKSIHFHGFSEVIKLKQVS